MPVSIVIAIHTADLHRCPGVSAAVTEALKTKVNSSNVEFTVMF